MKEASGELNLTVVTIIAIAAVAAIAAAFWPMVQGSINKHNNIYIVYTKEAQTADNYIEKVTHDLTQQYRVYVATSDALEQVIVSSKGAMRISARELEILVKETHEKEFNEFARKNKHMKNKIIKIMFEQVVEPFVQK